FEPGRADDRRGKPGTAGDPCERHLHCGSSARFGNLGEQSLEFEIRVAIIELLGETVALRACRLAFTLARTVAREEAARKRRPCATAEAVVLTERDHLPLFLAIDEIILVLHRSEFRPAVCRLRLRRLGQL